MSSPGPFVRFSHRVAQLAGRPLTFSAACALIVLWAIAGPLFQFSETWQLVVNTATTIITFLMVFVVQNTQNRDGEAVQAKLDELIYAIREADNRFVQAENLSDRELHALRDKLLEHCERAGRELERRGHGLKPSSQEPA
jgi:low affinity Fe/Cu permease